ncbi:MAG: hypothetical protein ABSA41_08160 [Terriglobia bacterium]
MFLDGQNLFYATREAFGCTGPSFERQRLLTGPQLLRLALVLNPESLILALVFWFLTPASCFSLHHIDRQGAAT